MMITLAKRCLEDGEFSLAERILNTSISMSVISEDLTISNRHKAKSLSKDFV
jgi:hypothetical protein